MRRMSMRRGASLLAAAGLLMSTLTLGAGGPPADRGYDAAAAARYLDQRMDLWWQKAKPLKTVGGETKCLSCHTAIPYALARPALGRTLGTTAPTAHETAILDAVRTRLSHLDEQQPFYDHTDAKKVESRGVEAVVNAFLLASHDVETGVTTPDAMTTKAFARLWQVQRADGAWDWLDFALEPYETTDAVYHGATLAAMAAGSPSGRQASADAAGTAGTAKLRAYLQTNLASQRLFNRTWALLASSRLTGLLSTADVDAIGAALEGAQRADGGWSLAGLGDWHWSKTAAPYVSPGQTDAARLAASDGYATGLVVYALKQAGRGDRPAVHKGLQWLRANQQPERAGDPAWAPWRAHSMNFDREHGGEKGEPWRRMFMSDLATAFAVLALQ